MRQVVLDTETTGLVPQDGHRIIEIGCVELNDRRLTGRSYHQYINPERDIPMGAENIHGFTLKDLADKPVFASIAEEFLEFVNGAELIMHNASFDVGFINHELSLLDKKPRKIESVCTVFDSLALARQMHPGQRNSLDALCTRYGIDNSQRAEFHGALRDAEILADVFIAMTSGQTNLGLSGESESGYSGAPVAEAIKRLADDRPKTPVILPDEAQLQAHNDWVKQAEKIQGKAVWQ